MKALMLSGILVLVEISHAGVTRDPASMRGTMWDTAQTGFTLTVQGPASPMKIENNRIEFPCKDAFDVSKKVVFTLHPVVGKKNPARLDGHFSIGNKESGSIVYSKKCWQASSGVFAKFMNDCFFREDRDFCRELSKHLYGSCNEGRFHEPTSRRNGAEKLKSHSAEFKKLLEAGKGTNCHYGKFEDCQRDEEQVRSLIVSLKHNKQSGKSLSFYKTTNDDREFFWSDVTTCLKANNITIRFDEHKAAGGNIVKR